MILSAAPAPPPPPDIWQRLETMLVVTTGQRCYQHQHLAGGGQRCCSTSYKAQDSPHNEESISPNANSASSKTSCKSAHHTHRKENSHYFPRRIFRVRLFLPSPCCLPAGQKRNIKAVSAAPWTGPWAGLIGNIEEEELAGAGADHHGRDREEGLKGGRGSAGRSDQDQGAGGFLGLWPWLLHLESWSD